MCNEGLNSYAVSQFKSLREILISNKNLESQSATARFVTWAAMRRQWRLRLLIVFILSSAFNTLPTWQVGLAIGVLINVYFKRIKTNVFYIIEGCLCSSSYLICILATEEKLNVLRY